MAKKAFSLVEISVVIVIMSTVLSVVIASRSLIEWAKINKIQEQARGFAQALTLFRTQYQCFPGDCLQNQIPDLISKGLNTACVNNMPYVACNPDVGCPGATPLNTESIETPAKRTCMMHEMQLGGFIDGVWPSYPTLTDTVAGKNVPLATFSRSAMVDLRAIEPNAISSGNPSWPTEGVPEYISGAFVVISEIDLILNGPYKGKHLFLFSKASYTTGLNPDMAILRTQQDPMVSSQYAISARMASRLDNKFDDGKPYTGLIVAGLTMNDQVNDNANGACNSLGSTAVGFFDPNPIIYKNTSTNVEKGCLVGYIFDLKKM